MNKIAVVFPGQGSQSVGMLADLYQYYPVVRDTFTHANDVLGFNLWDLIHNGPADELNKTINTQPAMLVAGVACWRALQERCNIKPQYFAGHSLGEYSALVASGQLDFVEAVQLSRKRARAMQNAVPQGVGAMAAVLGLDKEVILSVCEEVSGANGSAWVANDNALGQVVIAGHKNTVESVCDKLTNRGARRCVMLPVSVPSHCPLMQGAADEMQAEFENVLWKSAHTPVIHNYDVATHASEREIVDALVQQLIRPVRWVETIRYCATQGVDTIIEVGPGKVLSGLVKRIDRNIVSKSVNDVASLDEIVGLLNSNSSQ